MLSDVADLLGLRFYEQRYGVRLGLMVDPVADRIVFSDGDRPLCGAGGEVLIACTRQELEDGSYKEEWRDRVVVAALAAGRRAPEE